MRLRSFTGRTMSEAMGLVRQHLGPDAIIVSTQEDERRRMRVTAALDAADIPVRIAAPDSGVIDALEMALSAHGLAPELDRKDARSPRCPSRPRNRWWRSRARSRRSIAFKPLAPTKARRVDPARRSRPAPARR